jgi:hypothetical protein
LREAGIVLIALDALAEEVEKASVIRKEANLFISR